MAGTDWLSTFLKSHLELAIRKPQATSLARAKNFNKTIVNEFFGNLETVMRRHKFEVCDIYNMDETGVTTVQTPERVIGRKRKKQIGAITSQERGVLLTCAVSVNATGNSVPSFFIFPRKKFQEHFVRDGPTVCNGIANGSGWMMERISYCS